MRDHEYDATERPLNTHHVDQVCVPAASRALPQRIRLASSTYTPGMVVVAAGWPVAAAFAVLVAVAAVGLSLGFRVGEQAAWRRKLCCLNPTGGKLAAVA